MPAANAVRAWRPPIPGVNEVFHASYGSYAYPAHAHRTWTLFIVDDGTIECDLDGKPYRFDSAFVSLLPPHVTHDGRPATSRGFRMRVLYLEEAVFSEDRIGAAVDRPTIPSGSLRRSLSMIHRLMGHPDEALEAESRLALALEQVASHLGSQSSGEPADRLEASRPGPSRELAEELRSLIDTNLVGSVTLGAASRRLAASPAHLVRCFSRTFRLSPHAYQISRRIELARGQLLDGRPPADVAASVGFYDQAHFTRHFKRLVGTTPGLYRKPASG